MTIDNGMIVRVVRDELWQGYGFRLLIGSRLNGRLAIAQPLVFKDVDPGAFVAEPTLRMEPENAQALMDSLWAAGVRPAEGHGSAGQLGAVKEHLSDMRRIAFGRFGEKP